MKSQASFLLPSLLSISLIFSCISPSYQQSTSIPTCAQPCIASAIIEAGCKTGDRQCECANPTTIQNFASNCVLTACSLQDVNTAVAAGEAICAAYSASAAAGTSSTTSTASSSTTTPITQAASTTGSSSSSSSSPSTSASPGSSSSGSSPGSSSTLGGGSSSRKKKGLGTGAKAGIAVAAIAVVAIFAIFLFFFLRRRKHGQTPPPHDAMAAQEQGPYKPELQAVEAKQPPYTGMASKPEDHLKDNTYSTATAMPESNIVSGGGATQTSSVSPAIYSPAPTYHHELPSHPGSRIINVAEADSYPVPHDQEADSYPVPRGPEADSYTVPRGAEADSHAVSHRSEADSHAIAPTDHSYQSYTPYVPPGQGQAQDSAKIQEKDITSDIGRSVSQASNSTGISGLSGTAAGSGGASGSKLEVLETRLEKVRQEKERLSKLQELEEMEKDLKEEVMAERRKAMG